MSTACRGGGPRDPYDLATAQGRVVITESEKSADLRRKYGAFVGVGECRVCHRGRSLLKTHICLDCRVRQDDLVTVEQVPPPPFPLPTVPHELGHTLLMQYSEWLDEQRIDMFGPQHDGRTHSDLVDAFLAQRNPRAIPQLEK